MGGQRGEDPLENVACPFLFFLSGFREGDKHVSGPRLSLSSSESHPSMSSSPGIASSSGRRALYGPFSDPGETVLVLPLLGPFYRGQDRVGALGLDAKPVFLDSALERQEWHVLEAESMKVSCTIPEHPLQRVRMTESTAWTHHPCRRDTLGHHSGGITMKSLPFISSSRRVLCRPRSHISTSALSLR